jgi:demethoxyubiquinone hydroxylase (CLK1/Coq7/Cat5 family)
MKQRPELLLQLWVARLFILFTKTACLAKKLFHVCFTVKIINCNEFHSDLISLFEKLDKNIEIGNNE